MLEVADALELVLAEAKPLPPQLVTAGTAHGHVLAEAVVSDIDSPPHDKSIVDGYAVLADDTASAGALLVVLEEVTAGAVPTKRLQPGTATRIMTGAPLPDGADAVVMVEQTKLAGDRVEILQRAVKRGQNIMRRASSLARGQKVLEPGKIVRAIELGLLAEVGRAEVTVVPRPRVAIIATGNELVPPDQVPGPGQIRNSNELLLKGLVQQAGGAPVALGIARDEAEHLRRVIEQGLAHDVVVLSGGVSAGVLDLVPAQLERLGVRQIFHKVNLKPGKPLWFGVKATSEGRQTLVFGLPGNPVSSLVCFELFVRPAIERMRGLAGVGLPRRSGTLTCDHQQRGERPTYWPAKLENGQVTPLAWQGSGDLRTLSDANCLAVFPSGERRYVVGESIAVEIFAD
jgi:molybdopterin molybdotransferase